MNRKFIGNIKTFSQTGYNILNTGKNIDSIENIKISKLFKLLTYFFSVFGNGRFLWEGARVVTSFRSAPTIQIVLTLTPLKLFCEKCFYNDPFTPPPPTTTISFQTSPLGENTT